VIFTTAPRLAESRRRYNPNTHYLPNVADFDHFSKARHADTRVPDDLARIPEPRLGFVGAISGYKVDFELLRHLALSHPAWSIVLIGEIGEGDPWTDASELAGTPNLHLLGPRPYASLPAYMKGMQVGLLPSRLNDYTASMFPMKFFEYLAAGLQVVSVDLPALRSHADVAFLADSEAAYSAAIARALAGEGPSLDARLTCAAAHTYRTRTDEMLRVLAQIPALKGGG
jgi:glycosyltransferase involved in cell wall biosynthesis